MKRFVVTGTDTGVGKTVFAAALAGALGAYYWKPVQAGLDEETDSQTVARLSGLPPSKILSEAYRLKAPLSPHRAAEMEGLEINPAALQPPNVFPLVIEGAGGLMVPLRADLLAIEMFAHWRAPVILCARTCLGTINHSLLSIEALRSRDMPLLGMVFVGEANDDSEATICALGAARRLGRLPVLEPLDARGLAAAFRANFDLTDFGFAA